MDTKKFEIFLKVIEYGSFTKAAEAINYTPSGITHMMNSIEDEFGFTLLNRNKKGIQLTENGKIVLPIIQSIIDQQEILNQTVTEINNLNIGTIRIGSYSSIAVHWLPKIIKQFKLIYPNIQIKVYEGVRQEVLKLIDDKQIDIGFISYDEKLNYDWIFLKEDPMVAVLSKNNALAKASEYPISKVIDEQFIMPANGNDFDVVQLLKKSELTPKVAFETFENYSAIAMIEADLGMSIMNNLITQGRNNDVVLLPLYPRTKIDLGIILQKENLIGPAVKNFVALSKRIIEQNFQ